MSVKFLSAILGPEMAAPILWTPGKKKKRPFCRKSHVHKIPRFRGAGGGTLGFFLGGGGSSDFIFMGARIFLRKFVAQIKYLREAKPAGFQTRVFPTFFGKVPVVSRTLPGLFLVGALNRPRKRKRTNRENPRTVPEQIGKILEKSGKSQNFKRQKRKDKSRSGNPPV